MSDQRISNLGHVTDRASRLGMSIILQCDEIEINVPKLILQGKEYFSSISEALGDTIFILYFQTIEDMNLYKLLGRIQNGYAVYPWIMKAQVQYRLIDEFTNDI